MKILEVLDDIDGKTVAPPRSGLDMGEIEALAKKHPKVLGMHLANTAIDGRNVGDVIAAIDQLATREVDFEKICNAFQRAIFNSINISNAVRLINRFGSMQMDVDIVLDHIARTIKFDTSYSLRHLLNELEEVEDLVTRILTALKSEKHKQYISNIVTDVQYNHSDRDFHDMQEFFNLLLVVNHFGFVISDLDKKVIVKKILSIIKGVDEDDQRGYEIAADIVSELEKHANWPELAIIKKSLRSKHK